MGPFPHDAPKATISAANPAGTDGFEFVEFAHPEPAKLDTLFRQMGFVPVARHRTRDITLYRQGDINYLLNREPDSHASRFVAAHGPCAPAMAWRVVDAQQALKRALDLGAREYTGPGKSLDVPAVIGTIVLMMTLLLTSLAVVREREIGTLEQLMVSPLKPVELIIGKTLPSVFVAFVDLVLVTTVSLLWFHIPFRGSALFLLVASLAFILTGLGLGLLISAAQGTFNASGVFAAMIVLAVVALVVDFILTTTEHRLLKWRPQQF